MSDMTPPLPQSESDYDIGIWNAILNDEEIVGQTMVTDCVECGVPLEPHEQNKDDRGKFTDLCHDCCLLKLGLL